MTDAVRTLDPVQVRAVLALLDAATEADGASPLSEHAVLQVRHGGDPAVRHLLVPGGAAAEGTAAGVPAGYAYVEVQADGLVAELAVHPAHRRRGIGRHLAESVVAAAGPVRPLRAWAHGDHPGAAALAARLGFRRDRVLHRLRRDLDDPLDPPRLPAGVRLRAFRVGRDEDAWLRLNARAFASHPEQGAWTAADLTLREAEPWFSAPGFLLAEREADGALLGFHWTKVHPGAPPIGEVYVLGIDPDAAGLRLGSALALAGLAHLRERGLPAVMLYVEESNPRAMTLYTRLGFTPWTADISYVRD